MKQEIKRFANNALDIILPPRCVVSGEMVERQGMISAAAWGMLDFIDDPKCDKCGIPFGFDMQAIENAQGTYCALCLDDPPPFTIARAALSYNDQSRDLILGFKHGDQMHNVLAFTPWLRRASEDMLSRADAIIPVPLHYLRLIKRRYNQAAVMAQHLGRQAHVPVYVDALRRVRATVTQGHLSRDERSRNVKHAFVVGEKFKTHIRGKSLILIDDVYTTGATVKECTKVLLKAGARDVFVLTLARVVRE